MKKRLLCCTAILIMTMIFTACGTPPATPASPAATAPQAVVSTPTLAETLPPSQTPDHAFHNDTGSRYDPNAARDAWEKTLAWFEQYVRNS